MRVFRLKVRGTSGRFGPLWLAGFSLVSLVGKGSHGLLWTPCSRIPRYVVVDRSAGQLCARCASLSP